MLPSATASLEASLICGGVPQLGSRPLDGAAASCRECREEAPRMAEAILHGDKAPQPRRDGEEAPPALAAPEAASFHCGQAPQLGSRTVDGASASRREGREEV